MKAYDDLVTRRQIAAVMRIGYARGTHAVRTRYAQGTHAAHTVKHMQILQGLIWNPIKPYGIQWNPMRLYEIL